MHAQILSTKLTIPPLRSRAVRRLRLIQKLNQGLEFGVILVSAPAGYGKTTLLSAWLNQVKEHSTWLTLDEADNDPARFLAYLVAALQRIDTSVEHIHLDYETLPGSISIDELLTPLINQLVQLNHPFYLVLDDYHLIHDRFVQQVVNFLLEHRPLSLHLVIATRADPSLPLARLRATSQMLEIRQADLRFNNKEAGGFLERTMGLKISPADTSRLTDRLEGWIAGLQIAALSLQSIDDISSYLASLGENDYYIFDYLVKEVLASLPEEIRQFLLYTSILHKFTAPLCDALLDLKNQPYQMSTTELINELINRNLFISPLDNVYRWFRYHQLFSDLLVAVLEETNPCMSKELHYRASCWFEEKGMLLEALDHALAANDMERVARIVSTNVLVLIEGEEAHSVLNKIDTLFPKRLGSQPWLGIARAWAIGAYQVENSHRILDEVERNLETISDENERNRLKGLVAAARAFAYYHQGQKDQIIFYASLADKLLPEDEIAVRALNLTILGDSYAISDQTHDAPHYPLVRYNAESVPILQKALALALQSQRPHLILVTAENLANSFLGARMFRMAHHVCRQALDTVEAIQRCNDSPIGSTGNVYAVYGRVLSEWGENEAAIEAAQRALRLSEQQIQLSSEVQILGYLGRILVYAARWDQAREMLLRADMKARQISPWYAKVVAIYIVNTLLFIEGIEEDVLNRQLQRIRECDADLPLETQAKMCLRDGRYVEALNLLDRLAADLAEPASLRCVPILVFRAIAQQGLGNIAHALLSLQQALALAEPENWVAVFVREGETMERLLHLANDKGIGNEFIPRLLEVFNSRRKPLNIPTTSVESVVEPLSERELQVLRLLARGYADKQIASALTVTSQTVHQHLKNIYSKLDVHSRTEAVARAREMVLV